MKKHLPNLLTLANLFCGCVALVLLLQGPYYEKVALLIFAALIFDFFDGFLARLLKKTSQLGGQLDSLADLISFGLVPSVIAFNFLERSTLNHPFFSWCKWSAFAMVLCSAWRLANFNLDKTQKLNFKGLPTPANALFFIGISILNPKNVGYNLWNFVLNSPALLLLVLCLSCMLLICKFPMLSLKFSSFSWKENAARYLFLILSITLFFNMYLSALAFSIPIYVLVSLLYKKHLLAHS